MEVLCVGLLVADDKILTLLRVKHPNGDNRRQCEHYRQSGHFGDRENLTLLPHLNHDTSCAESVATNL
jgi:hypothetical protein